MKAVIVTGSRDWTDYEAVHRVLDEVKPRVVIHGDARGADGCASSWANNSNASWNELPIPAQWNRDGRGAGPRRNRRMASVALLLGECGYSVEVHAFPMPGSKGTVDMVRQARSCGLPVFVHGPHAEVCK